MAAILRWFDVGGERHRAYFRETTAGDRELVIAQRDWQATVGDVPVASVDELSEGQLSEYASRCRTDETATG